MKKTTPSKKKPTRKRTSPGRIQDLIKGLTKKEKELVLKFGPIAKPSFNEDGSPTQRYTVFQFVHGVAAVPNFKEEEKNYPTELYCCLLNALKNGDGSVFRDLADSIEAVSLGLNTGVLPES